MKHLRERAMPHDSTRRLLPHGCSGRTNMIRQITSRHISLFLQAALAAVVLCGPLAAADEPAKDKEEQAQREQGLRNMYRSADQYVLSSAQTPQQPFKFHETP